MKGAAKAQARDMRSRRVKAYAPDSFAQWKACKDVSLEELRRALGEMGLAVPVAGLNRFFARRGMTQKKRLAMLSSRTGPTSGSSAANGSTARSIWNRNAWSASAKPGPPPTCPAAMVAAPRASGCGWNSAWPSQEHYAGCPPARDRLGGADVARRPINGDWFEVYVAQVLVTTLCPGDSVIMDNLSSQKRLAVQDRIGQQAQRCVLPPQQS